MKNYSDKTEARYLSATSAVKSPPLYDAANRLTGVDGVSYTWDARGNLRSNGVFTYTYDGAGHMVRAERGRCGHDLRLGLGDGRAGDVERR